MVAKIRDLQQSLDGAKEDLDNEKAKCEKRALELKELGKRYEAMLRSMLVLEGSLGRSIETLKKQKSSRIEVIAICLRWINSRGVVSEAEDRFRSNSDLVYTARETAVLAGCTVADIVHGFGAEGDPTPCTLIVFDFELDRIKLSRTIH
ncbi:hypothetical protein GGTG_09872 [Gaeumannomyces tritici R3-111a-1]|uniref:Uncharacterized protein n=1 Tax=Gaeumannomyces tritici (strain R3-111a-1) TaxID=644352 RepID=J3P8N7_GAET3|nr:hypothetical protein GGTG_09872 [Gaeumannomyces tritici R3-111a-1]EJT73021.1 hypothetical protein GGTG_09872 [Gaeumannomyces tritici R3-111a-1]